MADQPTRRDYAAMSDEALAEATRAGNTAAYDELWRRHAGSAMLVAKQFSSLDAQDLVAESYARILRALQAGGGPTGAFRPYLYTTLRNVARSTGGRNREVAVEELDEQAFDTPVDPTAEGAERSLTMRAFRSLPERWQTVLWYTQVEGMTPQEIAPLLDLTPNSVSALALRAREGLREAWITAHLNDANASDECKWVIGKLAARARGTLSARDGRRVEVHLESCRRCMVAASEANEVAGQLRMVALPAILGAAAAGLLGLGGGLGALSSLESLNGSNGGTVDPGSQAGGSAGAGSGLAGGSLGVMGTVVGIGAAAAVTIGIMVAVIANQDAAPEPAPAAAPSQPVPSTPSPSAPPADPVVDVDEEPDDNPAVDEAPDRSSPTTPPVAPPPEPVITGPAADLLTNNPFIPFTGTGTPGAKVELFRNSTVYGTATVAGDGSWQITPSTRLPEGAVLMRVRQLRGGAASQSVGLQLTVDTIAPDAPVLTANVDNAEQLMWPHITVTAEPGSTVELLGDLGTIYRLETMQADASGVADFGQVNLPAGATTQVWARSIDPAGNVSDDSAPTDFTLAGIPFTATELSPALLGQPWQFEITDAGMPAGGAIVIQLNRLTPNPDYGQPGKPQYLYDVFPICGPGPNCTTAGALLYAAPSFPIQIESDPLLPGHYQVLVQYQHPAGWPGPDGVVEVIYSVTVP